MGYYLLDHPPASPQYRRPRRQPLSGAIGWHTTEGALDRIAPDTGAENVAAFIARRPDPGSYHAIHDSDSSVLMLPDDAEAFHVAADGINRWTVGQAAAMRTVDWHPSDPQTIAIIGRMAAWAVGFWQRSGFDPRACARWLDRSEVLARKPGMFLHGTVQGDRTDAWLRSPHRAVLESMTVQAILDLCPPEPTPTPEDDDMTYIRYNLHPSQSPSVWLVSARGKQGITDPDYLTAIEKAGAVSHVVDLSKSESASAAFRNGHP